MNHDTLRKMLTIMLVAMLALPFSLAVDGAIIVSNTTTSKNATPASSLTTIGGSFTTLVLNVTSQTLRWKAYVGNVSGRLTLDDASNKSIYDWRASTIAGEVYASRSSSITWTSIGCVDSTTVENEQTFLNIDANATDTINKTFNTTTHKSFYVSTTQISSSSCQATALYVSDAAQAVSEAAKFQEVLLVSGTDMVYASLLEPGSVGFNNQLYNFQMIVAEDVTTSTPTPYYFYVELT